MAPSQPNTSSNKDHALEQCAGILVLRPDGASAADAACVGLRSAFRHSVDLAAWHAAERPGMPPGDLLLATCLGRSVFDAGKADGDAPPICIGVEWLRYHHHALQQHQQQHRHADQVSDHAPLPAHSSGGAIIHTMQEEAQPAAQQQTCHSSPASPSGRPMAPQHSSTPPASMAGPSSSSPSREYGWFEGTAAKARILANEAREAYFGDADPLWFAKRFVERARINAGAMQKMALQLTAAAMGHLPAEGEEDDA